MVNLILMRKKNMMLMAHNKSLTIKYVQLKFINLEIELILFI